MTNLFSTDARGSRRAPKATCAKCHHDFTLGVNGIETEEGSVCDDCGNVVRDLGGYAWVSQPKMCMCYEIAGDNPKCTVHGGG